ncbi:MAG: hypothetical protein ACRDGN_11310 [bacterium]
MRDVGTYRRFASSKWFLGGAALAGGALALALGVPVSTLLIVAALLACPLSMYFGMRGMHGTQQGSGAMGCCPPGTEQAPGHGRVESAPAAGQEVEPARRG